MDFQGQPSIKIELLVQFCIWFYKQPIRWEPCIGTKLLTRAAIANPDGADYDALCLKSLGLPL